ncbi:MAG TPA: hypothetical protein VFE62_23210, partial [Gemmataceae bacterium]|nr:hypothetical protein [Gemmataceae bacterium]
MEGNQSLAKIGVFLLLGINVGAYYYFWPRNQDASKATANAASPEKGAGKLMPTSPFGAVEEQNAPPAFPLNVPGQPTIVIPAPPVVMQTEPLVPSAPLVAAQPVSLPQTVERRAVADDDKAIRDLIKQIGGKPPQNPAETLEPIQQVKELSQPAPLPKEVSIPELKIGSVHPPKLEIFEVPALPMEVGVKQPMPEKKESYGYPIDSGARFAPNAPVNIPAREVAIASPLTPKTAPARWTYTTDKVGERTQLTARLRDVNSERFLVEFRILCDRVDTNPQTGVAKAVGNISFTGAGWKGTCQMLTLTPHESSLVFEDRIEIVQDIVNATQQSVIRGDRIVWDQP